MSKSTDIILACAHENKTSQVKIPGRPGTVQCCTACWNASVLTRRAEDKARAAARKVTGKEKGLAFWAQYGIQPGDTVEQYAPNMLSPLLGGVMATGTAKVGSVGAYVSAPDFQPGQLSPKGWTKKS